MIIDVRRSTFHLRKPSHSYLCTGEGMSRIEIEPGEQLFIASSDLKDCFYHIELLAKTARHVKRNYGFVSASLFSIQPELRFEIFV